MKSVLTEETQMPIIPYLGTVLDRFHAKMGRLPSLEECNDIRVQNDERSIAPGTLRNAISKWKGKDFGTSRTLEALIQEFESETNSLPTLVQLNDIQIQNGQRSCTPSTYDKEIQKGNRQHSLSHSEYAESTFCIGCEKSDDDVSAEVEKWVHDLTHSTAERGIRKEGHIKPISDAVKERVQRDIDEYSGLFLTRFALIMMSQK